MGQVQGEQATTETKESAPLKEVKLSGGVYPVKDTHISKEAFENKFFTFLAENGWAFGGSVSEFTDVQH
jgi:hypothetical protein